MLDENLPTFFLKTSKDTPTHIESYYHTQYGSDPEATYTLHHLDPSSNAAKNTYAAALFDSYNPDILYGEVLVKPGWETPTLSQEDIRKNGGVAPPPQPIFPTEFTIQLYNPEQQVIVKQQTSKWSSTVNYEFSLPQTSFRTPSTSSLDRSQNDPGADVHTPKINFAWRKEGRLGKDLTCFMTGKSTDQTSKKKKSKEPDIAVSLFAGLREVSILESNLNRVELEDYKGLEVVLLLGAAVIRDLFYSNSKESFHILDATTRKNSGGLRGRTGSSPLQPTNITPPVTAPMLPSRQQPSRPVQDGTPPTALYSQPSRNNVKRNSLPPLQTGAQPNPRFDPRTQWEVDAETARIKAQVEAEDRERKRQDDIDRRRRAKTDQEQAKRTKKLLEAEEKERRRRQADVDRETERLRRQYGDQSNLLPPPGPQQRHSAPLLQGPFQHRPAPVPAQAPRPVNQGPYLQAPGHRPVASTSSFFGHGPPKPEPKLKTGKKSFWGLRTVSESQSPTTLRKKQSSMF